MRNFSIFIIALFFLSACQFIQHQTIEQGNVLNNNNISQIHLGMSMAQVKEVLGSPVLITLFNDNRFDYVYTIQDGTKAMHLQKFVCHFHKGRLTTIDQA